MLVKNITEIVVYESPDGGKTVYSRESGTSERNLIRMNDDPNSKLSNRIGRWVHILNLAQQHPGLEDLVTRAEVYYELIRSEKT